MSDSKFSPGDKVIVTSVNRRKPREAIVTKVGRKLVHVEGAYGGRAEVFRIDTGVRNDNYGHECVWTLADYADRESRMEAGRRIVDHGLRFDFGKERQFSTSALTQIADLLDALTTEES